MTDQKTRNKSVPSAGFIRRIFRFVSNLFKQRKSLIKASASWEDVKLEISAEVNRYLEMRHVQPDEVKQVIFHAETTGEKLYKPGADEFLGKLKIGRVTFYTDYLIGKESFIVKSAYTHRSEITG
jgi:glutamate synthase (NADPH/NADH) small chain